jgi:hypothetical protein
VRGEHRTRTSAARFTLARRTILALVVVCLTLAGHTAGSAALPSATGLLVCVILACGLTLAATSRQRGWPWLVAFLLASQLLIHVVMVLASPHGHGGGSVSPLLPTGNTAIGHLVASGIAAIVLARGEQTLISWSRLLSSSFGWLLPAQAEPAGAPKVVTRDGFWAPTPADCRGFVDRRGPPLQVAA